MKKKDNKGFSLVELLVAIAVSSIVISGLSYIIFTTLKLYNNNNANAEIQNESQTVLNLVTDSIMEAQGICMKLPKSGEDTDCILLGDLVVVEDISHSGQYAVLYYGAAIVFMKAEEDDGSGEVVPVREMYLVDVQDLGFDLLVDEDSEYDQYCQLIDNCDSEEDAAAQSLEKVKEEVYEMSAEEKLPWLMGRFVTGCIITPSEGMDALPMATVLHVNADPEDKYYFVEPYTLHIRLQFEYRQENSRAVTRVIEDDIAVRSRLKEIYVEDETRGMMKYSRR